MVEQTERNTGVQEVLNELNEHLLNPELIQNNKIHFSFENHLYRVRMPNQKELSLAAELKNELYIKLIQKPDTLTRQRLKQVLKKHQNIDIDKLSSRAKELEKEWVDLNLSLARKKDTEIKAIQILKTKIKAKCKEREDIILEVASYLSPSIESQVQDQYMKYLTFLCLEKYVEKDKKGSWESLWSKYEDYENDSSKIAHLGIGLLTHLMLEAGV